MLFGRGLCQRQGRSREELLPHLLTCIRQHTSAYVSIQATWRAMCQRLRRLREAPATTSPHLYLRTDLSAVRQRMSAAYAKLPHLFTCAYARHSMRLYICKDAGPGMPLPHSFMCVCVCVCVCDGSEGSREVGGARKTILGTCRGSDMQRPHTLVA